MNKYILEDFYQNRDIRIYDTVSPTLRSERIGLKVLKVGYMDSGTGKHQSNTVISPKGLSPAITTLQGGTQQIKVLVKEDERE